MLFRRALAFATILCLLIALMATPQGPVLVCRITGTPMAPVAVPDARPGDTCCTITVSADLSRFALSAPGCCELRQDEGRAVAPAVISDSPEIGAVALAPAAAAVPVPQYVTAAAPLEVPRYSAPRAPPRRFSSPRAPPVVS